MHALEVRDYLHSGVVPACARPLFTEVLLAFDTPNVPFVLSYLRLTPLSLRKKTVWCKLRPATPNGTFVLSIRSPATSLEFPGHCRRRHTAKWWRRALEQRSLCPADTHRQDDRALPCCCVSSDVVWSKRAERRQKRGTELARICLFDQYV